MTRIRQGSISNPILSGFPDIDSRKGSIFTRGSAAAETKVTLADSQAPQTNYDHTKLTFQSIIEDSCEQDSSTGSDPKQVARNIEATLTSTHLNCVNQILFDPKSSLRARFKEYLYLDDQSERLRKFYKQKSQCKWM